MEGLVAPLSVVVVGALVTVGLAALAVLVTNARGRFEAEVTGLRRRTGQLRRLIDVAPVPMLVVDLDSRVRLWNRATADLLGWAAPEVLGLPVPMVPSDKLAEWHRMREALVGGDSIFGLETSQRRRDGSLLAVSLSAAPFGCDQSGRPREIVLVVDDVGSRPRRTADG